MPFISFSSLIVATRTSNTVFNRNGEWGHFCFVPNLRGKALSFSLMNVMWVVGLSWKVKVLVIQSCPSLWNPWTVAYWAPLSMWFSRQEYWSGSHSLLQRIFLTQGLNLGLLHCRQMFNVWATREAQCGSVINSLYFAEIRFLYAIFVESFYLAWAQTVEPMLCQLYHCTITMPST